MNTAYRRNFFLFTLLGFLGVFAFARCTPTFTSDPVLKPTPTEEVCQFLPPAEPNYTPSDNSPTSFIELIDFAWLAGEISDGERLIYTAYGLYEPSLLPVKFTGVRLVDGTSSAVELDMAVQNPDIMCQLSQCEQEELKRVLDHGVNCDEIS